MSFWKPLIAAACLCLAAGWSVPAARAHGGPPLRLGVVADPAVSCVARLVLSHLREGVGFAADWREYPDEASLRAAFERGKLDIAVGLAAAGARRGAPAAAPCPADALAALADELRAAWKGEVFLLGFGLGSQDCARPALIVSRAVLEDLRFGILGKEARRLASGLIARQDVEAVRAALARGGERAAAAAARDVLGAKSGR